MVTSREKKSYSWSVGEIYTFEVIGVFLATFGPAQDVAKYSFTFRLQDFLLQLVVVVV